MMPWEREVYVAMLLQYIQEQEAKREAANRQ